MIAGTQSLSHIPAEILAEDYFENLHVAYNAMRGMFREKADGEGLTQEKISYLLNADPALISKRLNGFREFNFENS